MDPLWMMRDAHFRRPRMRPAIATPNAEYNVKFENLPAGRLRHKDHRLEWTRTEFGWSQTIAGRFGCGVRLGPIGPDDPAVGAPTQKAVFTRQAAGGAA